jgi:hypothetical protein
MVLVLTCSLPQCQSANPYLIESGYGWLQQSSPLASLSASGEDSYGARFKSGLFGGFLPQPPYFSGGQRRGFTFGLSAHRSCGQQKYRAVGRKKKEGLISSPLKSEALRPVW